MSENTLSNDENYWSKFQEEILEDLRHNPKYKPFFDAYNPRSIEFWQKSYARIKTIWTRYASTYSDLLLEQSCKYVDMASMKLWDIQKKKLFNLQCLWRAEEIQLPVEICYDFEYWHEHIETCHFLPPITEDEVDLYIRFLQYDSDSSDEYQHLGQNYNDYKEQVVGNVEEEDSNYPYPIWYSFYDEHMQTRDLLYLPDIRGKKEEKYMDLARAERAVARTATVQKAESSEARPNLHTWNRASELQNFVKKYEDPQNFRAYQAYWEVEDAGQEFSGDIQDILDKIMEENAVFPVAPHDDWREAIKIGYRNHKLNSLIRAIPDAYANYLFRLESGIQHESRNKNDYDLRNLFANLILQGRAAAGEPENFNF